MKRHIDGIHGKGWDCAECCRHFTSYEGFRRHVWSHTENYPFKCNRQKCCKQFVSKIAFDKHIYMHDNSNSNYYETPQICEKCGKELSTKKTLLAHIKRCASDVPPTRNFHCVLCIKTFTTKQSLMNHELSIHRGEKHPCMQCGKVLKHHTGLLRHKKTCVETGSSAEKHSDKI